MRPGKAKTATAKEWVEVAKRGALPEQQGRRLAKEDPEVLALALLAASKLTAELQGRGQGDALPQDPSGMDRLARTRET